MSVSYEWDMEEVDEHGDVADHSFADTLASSGFDRSELRPGRHEVEGFDLVLVRDDDNDRVWAYCSLIGGKLVLQDCWNNGIQGAGDMPNWKVPQRFHKELARWQK